MIRYEGQFSSTCFGLHNQEHRFLGCSHEWEHPRNARFELFLYKIPYLYLHSKNVKLTHYRVAGQEARLTVPDTRLTVIKLKTKFTICACFHPARMPARFTTIFMQIAAPLLIVQRQQTAFSKKLCPDWGIFILQPSLMKLHLTVALFHVRATQNTV